MLAKIIGFPKHLEVLIIVILGTCFLSLDFSLFQLKSNLEKIWSIQLDKTQSLEGLVKYILSGVVLARTFSLHAFMAFYIVMLWPAIYEENPSLMLPWLLLGIIRCLFLNCITFLMGTFICHKEKGLNPICLDFILAQIIEHGPSVYAWFCVLSFYRELSIKTSGQSSSESLDLSLPNLAYKGKSYSIGDLDRSEMKRFRLLPTDLPIEELIDELRLLIHKTKTDSSKSFDSLLHALETKDDDSDIFKFLEKSDLSVMEKSMKILDISAEEVSKAKKDKNRFIEALKEVTFDDRDLVDKKASRPITSKSFYIRKGNIRKGSKMHYLKSQSVYEDSRSHATCICFIKRKLQRENSNQTLMESEIANIEFDCVENASRDMETSECKANKSKENHKRLNENYLTEPKNFNKWDVEVGNLGFGSIEFIEKIGIKEKKSRNFSCQV